MHGHSQTEERIVGLVARGVRYRNLDLIGIVRLFFVPEDIKDRLNEVLLSLRLIKSFKYLGFLFIKAHDCIIGSINPSGVLPIRQFGKSIIEEF